MDVWNGRPISSIKASGMKDPAIPDSSDRPWILQFVEVYLDTYQQRYH